MSIKKELINTFKNLMGAFFEVSKVFSPSELHISDKAVGGKVELINSDGTLSPLEDGQYMMEDGFGFTLTDGLISEVTEQTAQDETYAKPTTGDTKSDVAVPANQEPVSGSTETDVETPAEDATETPADEVDEVEDEQTDARLTALEAKVAELEAMLTSAQGEKMEAQKAVESFNKIVSDLNENIKTLAKVPVQFAKTNTKPSVEENKQEKLFDLATLIGRIK